MSHTFEKLSENKVKITVTIPAAAVTDACIEAAEHMSKEMSFPGFRPGHAPYDVVKQKVGEMAILEHAVEELVRETFVEAMLAEDLETVGQPYFTMSKLAPGNDVVYTAEISLMPDITKLADYTTLSVSRKDIEPKEELVAQAAKDLLRMQTREIRATKDYTLAKGDKAVVHLHMKKDGVTLEGGESQNHGVYTNEAHYIPGFVDEIVGMKEGEERTFTLKFPDEHYQKHIAGQSVDFVVKLNEIFTLESPVIDDAFAKSLGLASASDVNIKLRENLRTENAAEEERRLEKAVLDAIADKSTFDTIPDLLVNQEIEKMLRELEYHIEQQGGEFKQYLTHIGKTLPELKLDFAAPALQRVKIGLVLRKIQHEQKITVDAAAVDAELDKMAATFKETDDARKEIYEPQYRDYIERQLVNRKTIEMLKMAMVK